MGKPFQPQLPRFQTSRVLPTDSSIFVCFYNCISYIDIEVTFLGKMGCPFPKSNREGFDLIQISRSYAWP